MRTAVRRILFARIADAENFNAQSKNAQHILRHWRSSHWRPTIIAFRDPDPRVAANPNVDILRIRPNRFWRHRMWRLKLWQIYQQPFDAIFYPGLHHRADYLGLRARSLTGRRVPVIATIEGLVGSTADNSRDEFYSSVAGHPVFCEKLGPALLDRVEWINKASDHLIAISPFLGRIAAAKYGNKVSQLPLGIDTSLFRRSEWHRHGRPRVVCAGTLCPRKRPEFFLPLARQFPAADFVWYGHGDLREALVSEARHHSLANLSFPGALQPEQLAREFASADIFVLPSLSEGVPKVTQEAAAAGLAEVVFGFFETPSVVDGDNGFVVWDDAQFKARLGQLLADPALVERMGRAGSRMTQRLNWEQVAPLWEQRIVEHAEAAAVTEPPRKLLV